METDVLLALEGPAGAIDGRALQEALGVVLELLSEAEHAASGQARAWTVARLATSSAIIGLAHPEPAATLKVLSSGLDELRRHARVPGSWTPQMVRGVRRLGRLAGTKGTEGVRLEVPRQSAHWAFDPVMTGHATQALSAVEVSLGSVSGLVDLWRERGRRQIGISLDDGGTLTARFSEALAERVRTEALHHRIEAWGELERNGAGQPVALNLVDFAVLDSPEIALTAGVLDGLFAGTGLTLDEWMEGRGGR